MGPVVVSFTGWGSVCIPCWTYARTIPAVGSGRRAHDSASSDRGAIRNSSFSTTSVTSPMPRSNTAVCSNSGVSIGR